MKTKENIHSGHRERLRNLIEANSVHNISDLHFLEHALTFSIPRSDTNPLAHRLLEHFKSMDNIFEAETNSLLNIEGIGPKTAELLKMLGRACYLYNKSKALKKPYVGTMNLAINFINNIIPPALTEQFVVLVLNKNLTVKNYKIFSGLSHSKISLQLNELSEYLISAKGGFCIFAHNHPYVSANPSKSDLDAFNKLGTLTQSLSITLIDNLILGHEDFYSYKHQQTYIYNTIDIDYKSLKLLKD